MAGLPATSNQGIAWASLASWSGVLDGWSSPSAGLTVSSGDLILVQASFTASCPSFSWSIQAPTGTVSVYQVANQSGGANQSDVIISPPKPQFNVVSPYVVQSRAALFQAQGPGAASFNLAFQQSSANTGTIGNLVLIARIIVPGAPS